MGKVSSPENWVLGENEVRLEVCCVVGTEVAVEGALGVQLLLFEVEEFESVRFWLLRDRLREVLVVESVLPLVVVDASAFFKDPSRLREVVSLVLWWILAASAGRTVLLLVWMMSLRFGLTVPEATLE